MTTPQRKIAQDAGRIESMMLKYQRQEGEVEPWHTVHDIAYRTGIKTDAVKKAVAYMHDLGMIKSKIGRRNIWHSLKEVTE